MLDTLNIIVQFNFYLFSSKYRLFLIIKKRSFSQGGIMYDFKIYFKKKQLILILYSFYLPPSL